MRSTRPMPGNPWPQDMVLRVTEDDRVLLQLLWTRAALRLNPPIGNPIPGRPELLPALPAPAEASPDLVDEWERAWVQLWHAELGRLARPQDLDLHEAIGRAAPESPERLALLTQRRGEGWSDRFGDDALSGGYHDWVRTLQDRAHAAQRVPLQQHPERRDLDALVPACERGLTTIVTVPCDGDYRTTDGQHTLVLTRAARDDSDRYRAALHSFRPQQPSPLH